MVCENIVIRPARVDDVETLARFSAAMAWETEKRRLETNRLLQGTLAVLQQPNRGIFYVAEERRSRGVIAQCLITYEWSDWRNGQFWWMQSVYVDPPWRRRGVYRLLHAGIKQQAETAPDVCGLRLYVEETNEAAQEAYRRTGMRPAGYLVFEEEFLIDSPTNGKEQT
jgi:GNAT superfamily N-acetyltransferase